MCDPRPFPPLTGFVADSLLWFQFEFMAFTSCERHFLSSNIPHQHRLTEPRSKSPWIIAMSRDGQVLSNYTSNSPWRAVDMIIPDPKWLIFLSVPGLELMPWRGSAGRHGGVPSRGTGGARAEAAVPRDLTMCFLQRKYGKLAMKQKRKDKTRDQLLGGF